MNKKSLLLLSVILIVLLVSCFFLFKKENNNWSNKQDAGESLLLNDFDVNRIAEITLKDSDETVTLYKKEGTWKVKDASDYPADFSKISSMILKISQLKPAQIIHAGKSQFNRLQLLKPENGDKKGTGTLLQFQDKSGGIIVSLIIGKNHSTESNNNDSYRPNYPNGRYLLVEGSTQPVLVANTFNNAVTNEASWLNKDFINIKNIKSIQYADKNKNNAWMVRRKDKNGKFKLQDVNDSEKQNDSAISSVKSALNYISFEDVSKIKSLEELRDKAEKGGTVTVKTFDGFTYIMTLAIKKDKGFANIIVNAELADKRIPKKDEKEKDKQKLDREFAADLQKLKDKLNREKFFNSWFYVVPKYKVEQLLKSHKELIKKKEVKNDNKSKEKQSKEKQ